MIDPRTRPAETAPADREQARDAAEMKPFDTGEADLAGANASGTTGGASGRAGRRAPGEGAVAGWRRQLGELALACAGSYPGEEAQRLRDLRALLAAAPAANLLCGLTVPSAERLDQLVAAEATASAALGLLGPDWGYLLSRGASGQHLASVILPLAAEEISASGDTLALALVGALGLALVDASLAQRPSRQSAPRTATRHLN